MITVTLDLVMPTEPHDLPVVRGKRGDEEAIADRVEYMSRHGVKDWHRSILCVHFQWIGPQDPSMLVIHVGIVPNEIDTAARPQNARVIHCCMRHNAAHSHDKDGVIPKSWVENGIVHHNVQMLSR